MTEDERATVVIAVQLIAKYGREAMEAIQHAFEQGALTQDEVDEAVAQFEDYE